MSHVVVVLPGQSYGPDLPALAIPIDVLRQRGADIVVVAYPSAPWPDWRRAETGDWSEVTNAIEHQIAPALANASRVTLVAKSMGTSVFGGVQPLLPSVCDAIWITPLFNDAAVRTGVVASGFRSLSVFGTADLVHDPVGQGEVTTKTMGAELAILGADHRLVVPGNAAATAEGFEAVRRAVEQFVGD